MEAYSHTIVVEGSGTFPLDMLRYDGLAPSGSADVALIDPTDYQRKRRVQLHRWQGKRWTPTTARWESFGWKVVSHESNPAR